MESFGKMMKPLGLALALVLIVVASAATSATSAFAADSATTPVVGNSNRKMKIIPVELLLVGHTEANCIKKGQPCGVFDPCCSQLYCTNPLQGVCTCVGKDQDCGIMNPCCEGYNCDGPFAGRCTKVGRSASPWEELGSSAYALEEA